jgi:hypothetical protein
VSKRKSLSGGSNLLGHYSYDQGKEGNQHGSRKSGGRGYQAACSYNWCRRRWDGEFVRWIVDDAGFSFSYFHRVFNLNSQSCAATLANHPDKFHITLIEKAPHCGGQATSIPLDPKFGASYLNDGVQGGSPAFKHTGRFFEKYGHKWHPVNLQISFGSGPTFWTNVFPSKLVERYQSDISRFGRLLKIIRYLMPVLGLVPIRIVLRLFGFSKGFGEDMVFPLVALFLGTGNQTANVSCAVLERFFGDENLGLWEYDEGMLLENLPEMVTFPPLGKFYEDWAADLRGRGVDIRLSTAVTKVLERREGNIVLETRSWDSEINDRAGEFAPQVIRDPRGGFVEGSEPKVERFDRMVMCVLADQALELLGKTATWRERFVLGGAKFYDDITITHTDSEYFNKMYETTFRDDLAADPKSAMQEEQLAFAKGAAERNKAGIPSGFRPMYFTHSYKEDGEKIEMSFDCTNYQHQFRLDDHGNDPGQPPPALADRHVYQTIFLDRDGSRHWTLRDIDPGRVVASKWWHQLGHRWQHYLRVVPLLMFVNGRRGTLFAGSWTLVNMHEVACVSGVAAAWRLGAAYEVFDGYAETFFSRYLGLCHGVWYRRRKGKVA